MKIISREQIEVLAAEVEQLDREGHKDAADQVQKHVLDDLVEYMAAAPEAEGVRNDICEHAGLSVGPAGLLN